MKNKKIIFVENDNTLPYLLKKDYTITKPTGGASVELEEIIKELIKYTNFSIAIISWIGSKAFIGSDLNDAITIFEASNLDKRHGVKYMINSLKAIWIFKPDYIFIKGNGFKIPFFLFCAKLTNCKTIFRFSSNTQVDGDIYVKYNNFLRGYLNPIIDKIILYGLKKTNYFLCQNIYQYNKITKIIKKKTNVYIIHDFIDLGFTSNLIKERTYIAWIGSFTIIKNINCLFDIAKNSPEIFFKVAGEFNTADKHENFEIVESLSKLPNVELVGYIQRKQMPDFIASAKGVLITSFNEGFSRVILEALSVGTPLVLTRNVDPDNIIENNCLGVVKDKHEHLKEGLKELLSIDNYELLSNRCKEYIIKNHNTKLGVAQIISIIEQDA